MVDLLCGTTIGDSASRGWLRHAGPLRNGAGGCLDLTLDVATDEGMAALKRDGFDRTAMTALARPLVRVMGPSDATAPASPV